jgi:hypothetical protein
MIIIETFERGGPARAPPSSGFASRTGTLCPNGISPHREPTRWRPVDIVHLRPTAPTSTALQRLHRHTLSSGEPRPPLDAAILIRQAYQCGRNSRREILKSP